jgi:putative acetyltransferase
MSFSIRPYHDDARACAEVYFHAVQHGTHEKYTEAQRNAWAPKIPDPFTYLADEACIVAEAKGKVIGFMSVNAEHHISMAFVHPDWHRQGVAGALYDQMLTSLKTPPKTVHASLIAQPFFEKRGWVAVEKEEHVIRGVMLIRHLMRLD